jgi:Asp-tRNA(Asn)/Glu-tRNA(Gln) amidotransferase A subunit family amidase
MDTAPDPFDSAIRIAADVRNGERTARSITEAALGRIAAVNPPLNAFTMVMADQALDAADAVDRAIASGASAAGDGLRLAGVPVAVKDHVWVRGVPATNGSRALADFVPDEDCVAVARLRSAGAVIVGKTTNPEFCYRGDTQSQLWGVTRNPWDLTLTPGGSSGGSAAAVAAGMVALAVGTDGGGSIRIPAAFCGITGHKPTFGLVPVLPGFRGWATLSVTGPLTRSVADAALMLRVMAGAHPADPAVGARPHDLDGAVRPRADLRGVRIGVSADFGFARIDVEVRRGFEEAVDDLRGLGAVVSRIEPRLAADPVAIWSTIAAAEGFASERGLLPHAELLGEDARTTVMTGAGISAADYIDAQYERRRICTAWAELFEQVDVIASPGEQVLPFTVGHEAPPEWAGDSGSAAEWWGMDAIANLTNRPAVCIPTGIADGGLPTGIQLMGTAFGDAALLDIAATIEAGRAAMPAPPGYR